MLRHTCNACLPENTSDKIIKIICRTTMSKVVCAVSYIFIELRKNKNVQAKDNVTIATIISVKKCNRF